MIGDNQIIGAPDASQRCGLIVDKCAYGATSRSMRERKKELRAGVSFKCKLRARPGLIAGGAN